MNTDGDQISSHGRILTVYSMAALQFFSLQWRLVVLQQKNPKTNQKQNPSTKTKQTTVPPLTTMQKLTLAKWQTGCLRLKSWFITNVSIPYFKVTDLSPSLVSRAVSWLVLIGWCHLLLIGVSELAILVYVNFFYESELVVQKTPLSFGLPLKWMKMYLSCKNNGGVFSLCLFCLISFFGSLICLCACLWVCFRCHSIIQRSACLNKTKKIIMTLLRRTHNAEVNPEANWRWRSR